MCGLAGFWDPTRADSDAMEATALGMADTLARRGPDDRGAWVDAPAGLALGFRRLAIIDLSPEGHQPMHSASGRYVIAFNGEIYNHHELRAGVGDAPFRGHSDTEVMLAAFERWGVEEATRRFVGMFAFALWDRTRRSLTLGRDRLGEKPLYYGRNNGVFLFGSELKALRAHPMCRPEVDRDAVALFLNHGYIPAPHSIDRGIRKLIPGSLLTLDEASLAHPGEPRAYWSAGEVALAGRADPWAGTESDAIDHLEDLLKRSIRGQMVADVPLGAFLSGGIDSSTVVALMQRLGSRPTRTFTIGFDEAQFDEAGHAREVAHRLGTDHTELYLSPAEAIGVIPDLPRMYDEPFADPSSIPVFLVSRLARREVTVCLSGDGGDELFGGYPWYPRARSLWNRLRWMTPRMRIASASLLSRMAGRWPAGSANSAGSSRRVTRDRLRILAGLLREGDGPEGVHHALMTRGGLITEAIRGHDGSALPRAGWLPRPEIGDPIERVMLSDMTTYLSDDVLAKVDRATMGVSLEARAPMLDHRIVEFAWRIPLSMKMRDGRGKWLLRQVLYRHIPAALIDRPKMGFSVPIGSWLRGPLRGWAEDLLSESSLARGDLLEPGPIRRRWDQHLSGERDWSTDLWNVLMLASWHSHR